MKRILLILVASSMFAVYAQQQPVLKNRRGIPILPDKGDFALGISAGPFFVFAGNMFNNSTANSAPAFTFAGPNNILFGKYMTDKDRAYRASFRIGMNSSSQSFDVPDMSPGTPINAVVTDIYKQRSSNIGLSFGIERRKGATRLQGIYGWEGMLQFSRSKQSWEYGNKLEHLDTGSYRVQKIDGVASLSIGLRVFAGVEYFLAPNFSVGGELGFGPSLDIRSSSTQVLERYDFANNVVAEEKRMLAPKTTGFSLDTDNYGGRIRLLFYF